MVILEVMLPMLLDFGEAHLRHFCEWNWPVCGGTMQVVERFTATQLLSDFRLIRRCIPRHA